MPPKIRDVLDMLRRDGWIEVATRVSTASSKAESNYAAYVPDLPGYVTTGATVEEVEANIREAIELHLAGLREDGQPILEPLSSVEYVDIAA